MAHTRGHICHCLGRLLHLRRRSPAIISGDRRRSGSEFVDDTLSLACGLSMSGFLLRGEVVAIAALNSDWYVEWMLAVTYIGGIIAPLNYRWSLKEARSAAEVVNPVLLVVDESCSSWASPLTNGNSLPSLRLCVLIGGITSSCLPPTGNVPVLTMDSIRKPSHATQIHDPTFAPQDVALICFTSGTTERSKGVAISHTALIIQSLAKVAIVGYGEDDVYLHTAPLCHIGGISSFIAMLMVGGCHVFIPKFDAKLASDAVEQHHVTSLITVPAMIADLITFTRKTSKWNGGETVSKILNGGGSLSPELIQGAIDVFPNAKIISAYGMTEACSSLTFITIYDPMPKKLRRRSLSSSKKMKSDSLHQHGGICVGKPAPHIELKIETDPTSLDSPLAGNILTRGLHVMVGYWDQLAKAFNSEKSCWLDTGDVGWLDGHGNLWLVGRSKDRIKSGGENIYPDEVEAVICQHPGVAGAVVVGIPDFRLTEKVVACVSVKEEWRWVDEKGNISLEANDISSKILQNFCRQRKLTAFKIPKIYMPWRKPFPLTTTGKLRREDVKKEVMSYMRILSSSL